MDQQSGKRSDAGRVAGPEEQTGPVEQAGVEEQTGPVEQAGVEEQTGPVEPYLCMTTAGLGLGVSVAQVLEVSETGRLSPIPLAPPHVAGLFNLRGHAVPLLDLAMFLELRREVSEEQELSRVVVVRAGGMRVGLLTDRVIGVREIPLSALRAPEVAQGQRLRQMARGELEQEGVLLVLLDLDRLLQAARVRP